MSAHVQGQTKERQAQLFKQSLRFQESAANVVIQRVTGSYLYRILAPLIRARTEAEANGLNPDTINPSQFKPMRGDALVDAIYNLDSIFSDCKRKGVDMLASAEGVAMEWKKDGASGHGCLLLAWKTTFDSSSKRLRSPQLVGAVALHKFKRTVNFSTDNRSLSDRDGSILVGENSMGNNERRNYFGRNTMYIDSLCAKDQGGVGKILVLHSIRWAIMRKCTGIIALSYSKHRLKSGTHPESYALFSSFGFEKTIPTANFAVQMYGTWFFQPLDTLNFEKILKESIDICARTGFTEATKNNLIWRCPN